MPGFDWHIALILGLMLGAALMAGGLAGFVHLPKVTVYLLVGVLLGPSLLNWIEEEHANLLEPLTKLAISLVLFNLGCHFPLARARRIFHRVLRLSLGEVITTLLLVAAGIWLLTGSWEMCVLLGALAVATAPATTILVLKETESEGPLTEFTNALVAANNLASILLFEVFFLTIHYLHDRLPSPMMELGQLLYDVVGSVALGIAGGVIAGFAFTLVGPSRRLILLIAIIMLLLGVCQIHSMPYLLAFLAMGVTVANTSDQRRQVLEELDRSTGLLCVVFFVVHGAELKLDKLVEAGLIGVAYVVLRFSGKYFGARLAATLGREEPTVRTWLGTALVAQAGAAIALADVAVRRTAQTAGPLHDLCLEVQTVILGTVVVFEIVGPVLIRQAVLRGGEVPVAQAIHHSSTGLGDQFVTFWNRLLVAAGYNPWQTKPVEKLTVRELMRKNVTAVPQAATFAELIEAIEHTHDNTYPVVGRTGELTGVIRYRELSNVLFDPAVGSVVRADDLTTPAKWVLHPDETAARAYDLFRASGDDCIPVVTRERPFQLQGLVRRRDVLRMLARRQIDPQEASGGG